MKLAVIPARKNSKRIPNKNIKNFCGKPIIFWPIKTLIETKLFDKIIVSTDSEKIAKISSNYGATIPFIRPKNISNDSSSTNDVICHAINFYKKKNINVDYVCCVYPTSVFVEKKDIKYGFNLLKKKNYNYVFSSYKFNNLNRSFKKNKSKGVSMFFPKNYNKNTQKLDDCLIDAAQFYWGLSKAWLNKIKIFNSNSFPINFESLKAQDIDDKDDWIKAELMFKYNNKI